MSEYYRGQDKRTAGPIPQVWRDTLASVCASQSVERRWNCSPGACTRRAPLVYLRWCLLFSSLHDAVLFGLPILAPWIFGRCYAAVTEFGASC